AAAGWYAFQRESLPLAALYMLRRRKDVPHAPYIHAISTRDGFVALSGDTYTPYALDAGMRAHEFGTIGRLLERVPLLWAFPHVDKGRVEELCKAIVADFRARLAAPGETAVIGSS